MNKNISVNKFNNKLKLRQLNLSMPLNLLQIISKKTSNLLENKIKLKLKKKKINYKTPIVLKNKKKYRFLKKYSLITKIFGVGSKKMIVFFKNLGLNSRLKIIKKKIFLLKKIKSLTTLNTFDGDLWSKLKSIIDFQISLKTYKGMRHKYKNPVRGQRTHTNAKTRKKQRTKGNKKVHVSKIKKKILPKIKATKKKIKKS